MVVVWFFLTLTWKAPQPECKPQFAPMQTGSSIGGFDLKFWTKADAGDWGGAGWLGWNRNSTTLQPVRLMVGESPKEIRDQDQVTVASVPNVTFAARCVTGLRPGKIVDAGVTNVDLRFSGPLDVTLGTRRYRLYLDGTHPYLADAKVMLAHAGRTQVLYSADGFADDPHFQIVWAGDLDRDGKLDLVVNLNRKYSWHPYQLLLSTKARGSDLVGEAAVFETGD